MKRFLLLVLIFGSRAFAASVGQEPVGHLTISCPGSSDTIVSLPLARPSVFVGSATAATITPESVATFTFSGSPFTSGALKYAAGTQPDTYYVFIAGGTKEGSYYTVTDNTTNVLTVDLNGDSLSGLTSPVKVKVVPYWTLNTVFPGGSGVTASDGFTAATQILVPNLADAGTNLAAAAIYYYSSAAGQWMESGESGSANDMVLYPDKYFTIRNNTATATSFTIVGSVVVNQISVPLATAASERQDNSVAISRPVTTTLNDSGLISSGAFSASTGFLPSDQLFVFDNTTPQIHKAAAKIYTYSAGAWRLSGSTGDAGADEIFTPGTGVLIRKAANATGVTSMWLNPSHISY